MGAYEQCEACRHLENPDGGYCYMFSDPPAEICLQHTQFDVVRRSLPTSMLISLAALGATLAAGKDRQT